MAYADRLKKAEVASGSSALFSGPFLTVPASQMAGSIREQALFLEWSLLLLIADIHLWIAILPSFAAPYFPMKGRNLPIRYGWIQRKQKTIRNKF
jgi:hypothetical protein